LVTDFGVVGVERGDDAPSEPSGPLRHGLTRSGTVVGTPFYMAPEQRAAGVVDARADQYAFCVALAEALPDPPRGLRALLARGRAARPEDRYPSMAALLGALEPRPLAPPRRALAAVPAP